MKKHVWARLALLLVTLSTLSGCIWVPYDDERGGGRGGDREGGRHEEHHDEHRGGEERGRY